MNRVALQPAFILHRRSYSNTSWIIECVTPEYGRVGLMAKGARSQKSRYRGMLELFTPLLISWSGRGELPSLTSVEFLNAPFSLQDHQLACGFYLNELLMRLLCRQDPCPKIFRLYQNTVVALSQTDVVAPLLRKFEKDLLAQLGYGMNYAQDWQTKASIDPNKWYYYTPDRGFSEPVPGVDAICFSGESVLALHQDHYATLAILQEAKQLMRLVLRHYLGKLPIKSRDLIG